MTHSPDGLVAYMRSPDATVNVPGAFDPNNRAGGTFTVPKYGLYQVTVRTGTGSGQNVYVSRNGNETLTELENDSE